jgi:glycyl-tRNA synthetase beta chain
MVTDTAKEIGGTAVIEEALLNEVTSLVEWPVPVLGAFDETFLQVPPEAIIATMKGNQKCFPVVDATGKLLPRFIAVSNLQSRHPELVRQGNERVIRPRLSDAAFFWNQDRAKRLESHLDPLKTVIFQNRLGSLYDKSNRVAKLAGTIAKLLGAEEAHGVRAALLSKCDLLTNMVSEFPELQGIMGEYYARHDGEPEAVAIALREQYLPRFAGDTLPTTVLGQALSIADKLDTLVGIFGISQPPKDPFGLRRAAISVLRMMIECQLPLDVQKLSIEAQANYFASEKTIQVQASYQVFDFILERLRAYYQDQGLRYDVVDAVLACGPTSPLDADYRIRSLAGFRDQPDFISLASANKRIHNILKKAEESFPTQPDPTHFSQAEEKQLYDQMETVRTLITPLVERGEYQPALQQLATLREPVDKFFDNVMVMADDVQVKQNRLAFLQTVRNLFLQVADISRLQV